MYRANIVSIHIQTVTQKIKKRKENSVVWATVGIIGHTYYTSFTHVIF